MINILSPKLLFFLETTKKIKRNLCKSVKSVGLLFKKKINFSIITGEVKKRANQIDNFQHDPNTLVFIGQISTAGLGITLTASSTMVFFSLDYSMSNFEQAKARIHRTGQKENCTYIYLLASNTVDEKMQFLVINDNPIPVVKLSILTDNPNIK